MINGETLKVTVLKIEDTVAKGEKLLYFIIPRSIAIGDGFTLEDRCLFPILGNIFDSFLLSHSSQVPWVFLIASVY